MLHPNLDIHASLKTSLIFCAMHNVQQVYIDMDLYY